MAKILPSELHPAEEVFHSLGQAAENFTLKGQNKTAAYETDDQTLILEARVHPWLKVEEDAPEEQPEAAPVEVVKPLAIDAGKNQNHEVVTAGVAETLASDTDEVEEVPADAPDTEPFEVFEDVEDQD